jgi:hypothetical protein
MSEQKEQAAQDSTKAAEADSSKPTETALGATDPKQTEAPKTDQAGEGKATESKAPEGKTEGVPEKYDLKIPEGSLLEASAVEKIAAYAKEQGLSQKQAEALLERENQAVADFAQGQTKQLEQKREEWLKTAQVDPEFGGTEFPKNVEIAKRVINRFGSDSFKAALNESGLGNHPELVRFCWRLGKAMTDDELIVPGAQGSGKRPIEEIFYGNSNQ